MKLVEIVSLTHCTVCGAKLGGKRGRDHRFGVCDKHVNESAMQHPMVPAVKAILWQDYKDDGYMSPSEEFPEQMDDEEFLEFEEHVEDVINFAKENNITDPQQAVDGYTDALVHAQHQHLQQTRH